MMWMDAERSLIFIIWTISLLFNYLLSQLSQYEAVITIRKYHFALAFSNEASQIFIIDYFIATH